MNIKRIFQLLKDKPIRREMDQTVTLSAECILRNGGAAKIREFFPAGTKIIVQETKMPVADRPSDRIIGWEK